jgi:hypothetical protein
MTETVRIGPWVKMLGSYDTITALQTARPASAETKGTMAHCDDQGLVWSNGTAWQPLMVGGAPQFLTSGASGTVSAGVDTVILNGVNTTFALTFPVPLGEGQQLHVNAAAAVSVAFSGVAAAPATTLKTVPSTLAAGVGVAWVYHVADTTWYRLY